MHNKQVEIKICGITKPSEIMILNEFGVEYAGFVFSKSIRQINIEAALKLSVLFDPSIMKVGVFTECNVELINEMVDSRIIDIVQIHTVDFTEIDKIKAPVWISFSISTDSIADRVNLLKYAQGIHLDTYDKKLAGGTGRTFDWNLAEGIITDRKLILSGGLNYTNVQNALAKINADIVDVSSGVEVIKDGIRGKDRELIRKFIKEVRSYEK